MIPPEENASPSSPPIAIEPEEYRAAADACRAAAFFSLGQAELQPYPAGRRVYINHAEGLRQLAVKLDLKADYG